MYPRRLSVSTSDDGAVRVLTLPGGALDAATAAELAAAADAAVDDRTIRVMVLDHVGADFCTGPADDLDPVDLGVDPAAALARIRVPVLAALRGRCHSVGLELALAADIRLLSPDASLALPDVAQGRGLPCWGGTQRLPRAVGSSRAAAMVLLGEVLDAPAALTAGLAWRIADDPRAAADEVAAQLCALGPLALEYAKDAVHRGSELPLRDGLRLEGDLNTLLATSADRAEGLAAFFAKRPPDFTGR